MFVALAARHRTSQRWHDIPTQLQNKQFQPLMFWYDYCISNAEPNKNN